MERYFEEIEKLEIEIVCTASRQNAHRLNELLSDSFEEVGASGRKWTKEEIINEIPSQPVSDVQLTGFSFLALSKETFLVKYQSQSKVRRAFRVSIWALENGTLKMLYHQGTPCD